MDKLSDLFPYLNRPYPPMGSEEERERLTAAIEAERKLDEILAALEESNESTK